MDCNRLEIDSADRRKEARVCEMEVCADGKSNESNVGIGPGVSPALDSSVIFFLFCLPVTGRYRITESEFS